MVFRTLLSIACAGLTLGVCQAQFTPAENAAIDQALQQGNLTRKDLRWDRRFTQDRWRMPMVDDALDEPIDAGNRMFEFAHKASNFSIRQMLQIASSQVTTRPKRAELLAKAPAALPIKSWNGPASLREPIFALVDGITIASRAVREATSGLSDEEKRQLIESLPVLMSEELPPKLDYVKLKPITLPQALMLLERVDLRAILEAAGDLNDVIDAQIPSLRKVPINAVGATSINVLVGGVRVRVYGGGNDIHDQSDAALEIDLGGNDTYTGRHAAGVGYASIAVDLAGDDRYMTKDLSLGSGILGIGIGRDLAGDDQYQTNSITLGSAFAGVGAWIDSQGNDVYRSTSLSQGFAAFGFGALVDSQGKDLYDVSLYGQGASKTGGVAILSDRAGDDVYRAGGVVIHAPLFTDVHYSFSQGFSSGFREDTGGTSGGIAMLLDTSGDDAYLAETFAQGASYWYSIGALYDGQGHDTYSGYHYVQASAMHMTAAYLFDLQGDDAYSVKYGAAHALGHDYGVALLFDRSGNDVYAGRDSQPGTGNANGVGIFIDASGDDRYQGPPGRGNAARGSISFGLFLDMAGLDRYRDGVSDGGSSVAAGFGIASDIENPRTTSPTNSTRIEWGTPGSIKIPSEAELAEIYRKATQWGVGSAADEVQINVGKLVEFGLPGLEWMLNKRLASADRLQYRAFVTVLNENGTSGKLMLAQKISSGSQEEKRNGLIIAVDSKAVEVSPLIPGLIGEPNLRNAAIKAAGALKSTESVDILMPLARERTNTGLLAIVALSQIGDKRAIGTAQELLKAESLPIRVAALDLLAKFPEEGTAIGDQYLLEPDERLNRIALELLGRCGTPESLDSVAERLLDPSPKLRISAILALQGQCPDSHRLTFMSLRNDPDPRVRAVAMRADPGR